MYNFDNFNLESGSTYSIGAQKKLLDRLLRERFFRRTEIHRLLATYPNAPLVDKNKIIIKLMRLIWERNESFETFRAFDQFLSIPKRGHFIHQFEVFLLGMNIILAASEKGYDLKKYFGSEEIPHLTYNWLFTSIAHDFGYPIELLEKIVGKLSELYSNFDLPGLSKRLDEIKVIKVLEEEPEFSKLLLPSPSHGGPEEKDIGTVVFEEVCQSLDVGPADLPRIVELQERLIKESNHGYVSAILLYRAVVKFIGEKESKRESTDWLKAGLKKAIAAVCLHSLKIDKDTDDSFYIDKFSFEKNPYAVILFLVDNIQDWNRAGFPDAKDKWAEYFLDKFSFEGDQLILNYRINHELWDSDAYESVGSFLSYKKQMLEKIKPASEPMKMTISVSFTTNLGYEFDPIVVNL